MATALLEPPVSPVAPPPKPDSEAADLQAAGHRATAPGQSLQENNPPPQAIIEIVDGEPIEREAMGLEAGYAAGECYAELRTYARERGGVAFPDGSCFRAFGPDGTRPRFPDASYVAAGRLESIPRGVGELAPDLCVEVVSPHDRFTDVRAKVEEYFAAGVREVWVIDPAVRTVDAYRPDAIRTYRPGGVLTCDDVLPGFQLAVDGLFPTTG